MTKREFFFSFFSLSFNFLLDVVQLIDVQLKLEGRTKEITTKRKKDREVNWRERKRRKRIAIRFTRNMWKLCFFFLPPFLSSPPHAGSGDRRIPLSVSSDVKRMKASRDRIVDSISPTNIDVVIFSLLRGRSGDF